MTVVVPRGTTARANSDGGTSALSMWTWASMNPGATIGAGEIDLGPGRVVTEADDEVARHRDAGLFDLAAEDVDDPPVAQQEVCGLVAPGVADEGLEVHDWHLTAISSQ